MKYLLFLFTIIIGGISSGMISIAFAHEGQGSKGSYVVAFLFGYLFFKGLIEITRLVLK